MLNDEASRRLDAIDGRLAEIEAQVKHLHKTLSELASELTGRSAPALGVDAERTARAKPTPGLSVTCDALRHTRKWAPGRCSGVL